MDEALLVWGLGQEGFRIVATIGDIDERQRMVAASSICIKALKSIEALDLSQHETVGESTADLTVWIDLAPAIRGFLVGLQTACTELTDVLHLQPLAPESQDLSSMDIEFDMVDDPSPVKPVKDQRESALNGLTQALPSAPRQIQQNVCTLVEMLKEDFIRLGERLKKPAIVSDRWALLGELQEFRGRCGQCLEAILATLLRPFALRDPELIIPRFRRTETRARELRAMIVDLAYDFAGLNDQMQSAGESEAADILKAIAKRLLAFRTSAPYEDLRAPDKIEFVRFSEEVDRLAAELNPLAARRAIEGFEKFLEVMRSINQRQVLARHDQRIITSLTAEKGQHSDREVLTTLETVYGRFPPLDDMIRAHRLEIPVPSEAIWATLAAAQMSFH